MSKKLIAILFIFIAATSALIFLKFIYLKASPLQSIHDIGLQPTPIPEASISLFPGLLVATASQSAQINVAVNSNLADNSSKLIQFELSYEPTALYYVKVVPGDYLINPEVVLNNIDIRTGRISYAIKGDSSNPNSNIVAVVNFNIANYGIHKETEISFLPKTLIRQGEEKINLKAASGAKIILKPLFFIPPASPSAAVVR